MPKKPEPEDDELDDRPEQQTDLAEGELDTVEESIKEHEKKHDQNA